MMGNSCSGTAHPTSQCLEHHIRSPDRDASGSGSGEKRTDVRKGGSEDVVKSTRELDREWDQIQRDWHEAMTRWHLIGTKTWNDHVQTMYGVMHQERAQLRKNAQADVLQTLHKLRDEHRLLGDEHRDKIVQERRAFEIEVEWKQRALRQILIEHSRDALVKLKREWEARQK